jgi:hypothetical protein
MEAGFVLRMGSLTRGWLWTRPGRDELLDEEAALALIEGGSESGDEDEERDG